MSNHIEPNPVRFVMVGGFLGAGKTTTLARLARHYMSQGLSVGIVTNDQAADLVDTMSLRSQGFDVGEVAGACFCCRFNDLISTIDQLGLQQAPDVILAEPVGSCTDLVATVIQPLKQLFKSRFQIAPYGVILKPSQHSLYDNLVNAIDELNITNITSYAIADISSKDIDMMKQKGAY